MILGQVVERHARLAPEHTALVYEGRRLTQRDWAALVRRSAQHSSKRLHFRSKLIHFQLRQKCLTTVMDRCSFRR